MRKKIATINNDCEIVGFHWQAFIRHVIFLLLLPLSQWTTAQTTSGVAHITLVETGWNDDQFRIAVDQPLVNPANCPSTDGYIAEYAAPGYKTHYAAALMAFATGKSVWVTVSNTECQATRPKIWGIRISQ